jgi:hypothetical protein
MLDSCVFATSKRILPVGYLGYGEHRRCPPAHTPRWSSSVAPKVVKDYVRPGAVREMAVGTDLCLTQADR